MEPPDVDKNTQIYYSLPRTVLHAIGLFISRIGLRPCRKRRNVSTSEAILRYYISTTNMISLRLTRVGKKKRPMYRLIAIPKHRDPWANNLEILGTIDPRTKEKTLNAERIQYWLSVGAQPSDTVRNILISEGIMEGKKVAASKLTKKRKAKMGEKENAAKEAKKKAAEAKAAADAEEKTKEEAAPEPEAEETPAEPAETAPEPEGETTEATPTEEPKEEISE